MTKAQARTVTKHINLRQSDYPGYKAHPYQSTKGARTEEKKYRTCVGLAPKFAEMHSASYDDGHAGLFSSVTEFVASRADAQADDQKAASQRARDCFKQELMDIASAVHSSGTQVTITPIAVASVAGVDAIYGYKYTATFTVLGYHGTLHGWSIGFSRGNAEVTLNEVGTENVPQAKLEAPKATLIGRAKNKVPANGLPVRHT